MIYRINAAIPSSNIGYKIKKHTQDVYKTVYNANINPTPDEFIYLESDGEIYASFGITYRNNKKLFSECYLDILLEEKHAFGHLVNCEVGSFISVKSGFGVQLYKLLPYILHEKNISYVLVTLTSKVRMIFDRLHFKTVYLNDATEDKVPIKNIWGSFYKSNPKTFIMNVQKSCSDISLEEYSEKLNITVNNIGKILKKDSIYNFYNLNFSKDIDIPPTYIMDQKPYKDLLELQTNYERITDEDIQK